MRFFPKNPALSVFYPYSTLTSWEVSEKFYEPFWRKHVYLLTYWQWWNHRTPFCPKAGIQKELTESRSNKYLNNHESNEICNYHHYEYWVYWRPLRKCQHLLHTKNGKCNTRTATFSKIWKRVRTIMKESENNDNSVVSEYAEIFEEALSQEEIESTGNTH